MSLSSVWRALAGYLYPVLCVGCGQRMPGDVGGYELEHWLCAQCSPGLHSLEPPFCNRCGEAYEGALEGEFRCGNCAQRQLAFEYARAGYHAEGLVRELVHQFKYGKQLHLRRVLGSLAMAAFQDPRLQELLSRQPLLVPVPLHPVRKRWRGFNQSEVLAQQLSRHLKLPVVNALDRIMPTEAQAGLTRVQRLTNLRQAFAVKPRFRQAGAELRGRCVILVDDVFTTGSTAHECARVLVKTAGVEKVVVVTVARG
jgi:competence protein ComFC